MDTDQAWCENCNIELELVKPGKHQHPDPDCEPQCLKCNEFLIDGKHSDPAVAWPCSMLNIQKTSRGQTQDGLTFVCNEHGKKGFYSLSWALPEYTGIQLTCGCFWRVNEDGSLTNTYRRK